MQNHNNKREYSNKEILIIGFSLGIPYLLASWFFPRNALLNGLFAAVGLLIGLFIVKLLRKKIRNENPTTNRTTKPNNC